MNWGREVMEGRELLLLGYLREVLSTRLIFSAYLYIALLNKEKQSGGGVKNVDGFPLKI